MPGFPEVVSEKELGYGMSAGGLGSYQSDPGLIGKGASHLSVFHQICPHAGAIAAAHKHMVSEEVDARHGTGELAAGCLVSVAHVGHHVVKAQHLITLVRPPQASVESNSRNVASRGGCPSWAWTGRTWGTWPTWLSRGSSGTWRSRRPPQACLPAPAYLSLGTWGERGH